MTQVTSSHMHICWWISNLQQDVPSSSSIGAPIWEIAWIEDIYIPRILGASLNTPWVTAACTSTEFICVAQEVTDVWPQSISFQKTSCLKYSISIETTPTTPTSGSGTFWCMYAEDGDKSYFPHHSVLISEFSAHLEQVLRRISLSGQSFLSTLNITIPGARLGQEEQTTSLLRLNIPIVYAMSALIQRACS